MKNDGMILLQKLQQQLEEPDFIFVRVVARLIWMRRNSFVFEGLFSPPLHLIQQANATLEEFKATTVHGEPRLLVRTPMIHKWIKPPLGSIKVNWDASLDINGKRMGMGIVARDDSGSFLAAVVLTMPYIRDPEVAEALTARRAVYFGGELGQRP